MSVQTTYAQTPAVAYPGMLAEHFSQRQIDSAIAEDSIIGGSAVEAGTDPTKQALRLATLANWSGVAVTSYENKETTSGSPITYEAKDTLPVMYRGRIWVTASAAVAVGAQVIPGVGANAVKFAGGTGTGNTKAYARTAAAADGDLMLIELISPVAP